MKQTHTNLNFPDIFDTEVSSAITTVHTIEKGSKLRSIIRNTLFIQIEA